MNEEATFDDPEYRTTQQDRNSYVAVMSRVKLRIDEAEKELRKPQGDERNIIYAALQLRLAIEEIAFSSFVANRQALEEAARSTRVKKWDEARKALSAINSKYWPIGVELVSLDGEPDRWDSKIDQLTEEACAPAWGRLSTLLHARNPALPALDLTEEAAFAEDLVGKLRATLNEHLVHMVGEKELLCCQVGAEPIRLYVFERRD